MRVLSLTNWAQMLVVLGAGPAIVLIHVEILLQQHRGGLHGRRGRRKWSPFCSTSAASKPTDQDGNAAFGREASSPQAMNALPAISTKVRP